MADPDNEPLVLTWRELDAAPQDPGVYGWYYQPWISVPDLERLAASLEAGDEASKAAVMRNYLDDLFGYARESPYHVHLRGPLKPTYSGQVHQESPVSDDLVRALSQNPERLLTLPDLLAASLDTFQVPLYIGKSKKLRKRLLQHKKRIQDLAELYDAGKALPPLEDVDDESVFAHRVVARKISPPRLTCRIFVTTDEAAAVMLENLLNRLLFPVLGRN